MNNVVTMKELALNWYEGYINQALIDGIRVPQENIDQCRTMRLESCQQPEYQEPVKVVRGFSR